MHDDPLVLPGVQDLSAWVDFSLAASAGIDAGATVAGYVSQAAFVMAGGLEAELEGLASLDEAERFELSRQVKMLTLPGEMGERFKCLGLSRGSAPPLPALGVNDRTHTL